MFIDADVETSGESAIKISPSWVYALVHHLAAHTGAIAGRDALTDCAANDFGTNLVRVNSIAQTHTATPTTSKEVHMPGLEVALLNEYPVGRVGTIDGVASAAAEPYAVRDQHGVEGGRR